MDNSSLHHQPKSSWAYLIVLFVVIIFGLFWIIQSKSVETTTPAPVQPVPQKSSSLEMTQDLEASVSAIEIPDYSDEF